MEGYASLLSPARSPVAPPRHGSSSTSRVVESSSTVTRHVVSADGRSNIFLQGRGLKEARVKQEAEFIIDASQCPSGRCQQKTQLKPIIKQQTLNIHYNNVKILQQKKLELNVMTIFFIWQANLWLTCRANQWAAYCQ